MDQERTKVHPGFKFNDIHCDKDTLFEIGYSFIKEGERFEPHIGDFLINWLSEDDEILVKTSGSTGSPKTIALKKESMIQSALSTGEFFDLPYGSKALLCLSADNIAGKMMLVRAMVLGWSLDVVAPSSMPLVGLNKDYDFCAMVPYQLRKSLNLLEQVRTIIVGGAAFPADLEEKVRGLNTAIYETYGMTETASHVALRQIRTRAVQRRTIEEHIFTALPGVTLSQDHRGCLVIDAPGITGDQIVTNDLVTMVSETGFQWLGRWDNVINSGGVKLIAEELEAKFSDHLNNRILLLGLPDEALGERLVLVNEGEIDEAETITKLRQIDDLHAYQIPKHVVALKRFPETKNGKPIRSEIRKLVLQKLSTEG